MFSWGPCFKAPFGSLFDVVLAPFWETIWTREQVKTPKRWPEDYSKRGPKKIPIFRTPFFVKMGSKMGGGLHISSFVPAPSQTLPLLPTPLLYTLRVIQ